MKIRKNLIKELNDLLMAASDTYTAMRGLSLRKSFQKIDSLAAYEQIPITSKEDFYNYDLSNKFAYIKRSRLDENGQEPILPLTKTDYWNYVKSEVGRFKAIGVKKSDRISVVNFTINETIPIVNSLMELGATYVVTEGDLDLICDDLIKKKVDVIFTYYRMLENILDYVESKNLNLNLRMVIVTAEPIGEKDALKKRVKKTLKAKLVDTIGTREIGGYAYECKEKNYYHFLDSLYPETVDVKTREKTSGKGELLITPLWRKDLPLIRFATGDLVKLKQKTCSCEVANALVFEKILGRVAENVKISSSMIDLRKIYFEVKELIHQQYTVVDNLLWRFFEGIRFSILFSKEKEVDVLIIFIERKTFNLFLRRKRVIIDKLASQLKIGVEVVLLDSKTFNQLPKKRYLDIRYIKKNKIPKSLREIMSERKLSFDL